MFAIAVKENKMGIINKLKYGKYYDLLIKEYEVLKEEFKEYEELFYIINNEVLTYFKDQEAAHYEFEVRHSKYRDVVSVVIVNSLADIILTTGKYHLYRGLLNPTGGHALSLFYKLVDNLEKSGYYTKEKADEDRKWIKKEIKEVG